MRKGILFLSIILGTLQSIKSQTAPGQWNDHLPYHMAQKVVLAGSRVYCMTSNSLFYYSKTDNTINTISKVQGLTECEFSTIAYSSNFDMLIIAYSNSNIDIVQKKRIVNIPYIKNKLGISDKTINNITIIGNYAYLACNYGISVLDLEKLEIKDTYYPSNSGESNKVYNVCFDSTNVYAATQNGIFKANKDNQFLVNYSNWLKIYNHECNRMQWVNGYLFAAFHPISSPITDSIMYSNGNNNWSKLNIDAKWVLSLDASNNLLLVSTLWNVYAVDKNLNNYIIGWSQTPKQAALDLEGTLWTADNNQSLIKRPKNGGNEIIAPNSPYYPNVAKIDCKSSAVWTAGGAKNETWAPMVSNSGVEGYYNNTWHCYASAFTEFLADMSDLVNIKIDPLNPNRVFMANWTTCDRTYGLLEYNNGSFSVYNDKNSTLNKFSISSYTAFYTYGLSFDTDDNLWVTNSYVAKPLSVLTNQGKWYSFSLGKDVNNGLIGDVVATSWGHKWIFSGRSTRITIFDDNGTIDKTSDDQLTSVTLSGISSTINSANIYCMVEDKNQTIWVGTDAGPVVFYYPQDAFNTTISGEKILVPLSKNSTNAAYLLETERINAIAVDGNNRKWMGTQNSGIYLFSNDGKTLVAHFTADNSPLLSNTINDISIDGKSGEVYFGTDKGLISYRGNATEGGSDFGKVYVFPNPVRENYNGNIYITGLLENCNVKITDISGSLVFETNALGGQAVWNGKNLLNNRVNTGVYLVFCSNSDGSKTFVTKLLFIH